jgi:integrase
VLNHVKNTRHRALLMLIYLAGMRVGVVVRLRACDLDLERHLVHIRRGKGRKGRYTHPPHPHIAVSGGGRQDRPLTVRSVRNTVARPPRDRDHQEADA